MKKGFTLIEIMITLVIIVAVGLVATLSLQGGKNAADLTDATKQIATLLREAQSDSMAQSQGALWGVHFDNTTSSQAFYSLFYTQSSYASSTQSGGRYLLPSDLCYATSSVAVGSSTDIIFSSLSGAPSAPATITLQLMVGGGCSTATSTAAPAVSRSASGKIFFDDFNRSNL